MASSRVAVQIHCTTQESVPAVNRDKAVLQTCAVACLPVDVSCHVTRAAPTAVLLNDLADVITSLNGSSAPGSTAPSI
jgi:hypothetical protein